MEILVRRSDLVKELQLVQGIVERKNSIPILSNVLVEASGDRLRVSATDLDVSLRCGCGAQVVREGAVTLGAKKLYEIVRSLPESDVRIDVQPDAWATIECERSVFKVAGLPREDFPTLPDTRAGKTVDIPAAVLAALIQRTGFAITAEDARYYLAGALLILEAGSAAMVATDGHRLAWAQRRAEIKVPEAVKVLVPRKAIAELSRLIEGEETLGFQRAEGHLLFTAGGRVLASKMVEAQFPAYEKVIAVVGDKKLSLGREVLLSAIRRVSLLSSERNRAIRVAVDDGRLELSASSPDLGEARESVPTEYTGDAVEIGFNAQYLLDFLSVAGTDEVGLELKDSESQGLLRPIGDSDGDDYRYVVMPMRF
jgi:DNA polymerase-3 subunit beta